jgi:hypothetical protein
MDFWRAALIIDMGDRAELYYAELCYDVTRITILPPCRTDKIKLGVDFYRKGFYRLHQFDAVAERVIDIGATESIKRLIPNDRSARLFAQPDDFIQTFDEQSGMRFPRGPEIRFDAEVDFQSSLLKPDSAAHGEMWRLGLLNQSQDARVERPRRLLFVRRHRQLDVFDGVGFHINRPVIARSAK